MGEEPTARDSVDTGGEPETLGRCTECGEIYPVQREDGELRPIGTDGVCECGNDRFEPPAGE
jgi:hypothetical protein